MRVPQEDTSRLSGCKGGAQNVCVCVQEETSRLSGCKGGAQNVCVCVTLCVCECVCDCVCVRVGACALDCWRGTVCGRPKPAGFEGTTEGGHKQVARLRGGKGRRDV